MRKVLFCLTIFACASIAAVAQPRPTSTATTAADVKPAPASVAAKYEGGMFGYREKKEGTLRFDDTNKRIVFFDKTNREMISIPYDSLLVIQPTSTSSTSTAGNVISAAPVMGSGLGRLLKEKKRYIVLQFDDPDADVRGSVNFKIEGKEMLESLIHTLGTKAKLTQRGDAYYRPRPARTVI
jgi:hypothetical protein